MPRKRWTPSTDERRQVEAMSAYGVPQEDIARVLKVDPKTLRRHCREELDNAAVKANSRVAESLFNQCIGRPAQYDQAGNELRAEQKPSVSAAIFWLKTRAGWKETSTHELTGKDGGPVQTVDLAVLKDLDDDELQLLERIAGKIAAAGGDTGGEGETES